MLSLKQVQDNQCLLEFIKQADKRLRVLQYTSHGLDHSDLVAARARTIAREIGLTKKDQEMAAIAGFAHDFGNFLSRTYHNYLAATLFHQIFSSEFTPQEIAPIMQAIVNHDKDEMEFSDSISAVLILADKSDVRKSRVMIKDIKTIRQDIHNRVNYATNFSKLGIDKKNKKIVLTLSIDANFVPIMEYFEIFTDRMIYCRKAAQCLGYKFGLIINNFKLL